jgi:hypothetical protein
LGWGVGGVWVKVVEIYFSNIDLGSWGKALNLVLSEFKKWLGEGREFI